VAQIHFYSSVGVAPLVTGVLLHKLNQFHFHYIVNASSRVILFKYKFILFVANLPMGSIAAVKFFANLDSQ